MAEKEHHIPENWVTVKKAFLWGFGFIALSVNWLGCESTPSARVLRLISQPDGGHWELSVNNRSHESGLSNSDLTNRVTRLGLRHGDVILLEKPKSGRPASTVDAGEWLRCYCASNEVAFYVHPAPPLSGSIFSVPIYHWVSPFSTPRNLEETSFFYEGTFFGRGQPGFRKLLQHVGRNPGHEIFILGSLYDWRLALGPLEAPYESQQYSLDSVLRRSHKTLLLPSQMP